MARWGYWPWALGLALAVAGAGARQGSAQPQDAGGPALVIAARRLPTFLSPATATTSAERQAVELLFEGLVEPEAAAFGARYRPQLAAGLPAADQLETPIALRPMARWSDGQPLTAADVRHAYALGAARAPAWKTLFDLPRLQAPTELMWVSRQGLPDPFFALTTKIIPQQHRSKPLNDPADAVFAQAPVGSGPFAFAGKERDGGRDVVVLRRNEHHPATTSPAEIRFVAWKEAADLTAAKPHVVLEVTAADLPGLRKLGYEVRTLLPARVYMVALNHRRPALKNAALRRALAAGLDRAALLKEHHAGSEAGPVQAVGVTGPFPAASWANAAPPRVPAQLHQPELAQSLVNAAAKELGPISLTLKFADDDPRNAPCVAAMCSQWETALGVVRVKPQALAPHALRAALQAHDFDLALCPLDRADAVLPLVFLLDPNPDALKPGGANFMSYTNDAKLQSLLGAILARRQFDARRDLMHDLHAHLVEAMPFIPLWQLPEHVALHSSVQAPPDLDPLRVLAGVHAWRIK